MRRTSDATRDVVTLGFRENPRHVSILFVEAGLLGACNRIEAERDLWWRTGRAEHRTAG
jgi:hypothetical protein